MAKAPVDEGRFLYFLEQCTKIAELLFKNDSLRQPVLNQLPTKCRRLQNLFVRDIRSPIDFNPIYKLNELLQLTIGVGEHLENPPNCIRLLNECRYLTNISLGRFTISMGTSKRFLFKYYKENDCFESENLSLEELKITLRQFV